MSNQSLWNKDFLLDTGINFVVYLIYYLLMVIIAVVAKDQLHASLGEAGLASGIFIVGTLLARLQFGKAIELYGRRKSLYGGILFYFVTTLLYFYIPNLAILYGIRFLNGMAYGIVSTATNTIVASCIPAEKRGEGINYYGLSTSLAAAVGSGCPHVSHDPRQLRRISRTDHLHHRLLHGLRLFQRPDILGRLCS